MQKILKQQIFYSNASFANPNKERWRNAPPFFIWVLNRTDLPLAGFEMIKFRDV